MTTRLPPLRRQRRRINLASVASRFMKGVAAVEATIEPTALWWDRWNHDAMQQDGPLWIALGDSVTQGIGASHPTQSYAARTHARLRARTDTPWRLINLSMSGGRFSDVVDTQLEVINEYKLRPTVVSALIGSNDVIWRRDTDGVINDARRMTEALPVGTVLSRVSEAKRDRRRAGVNQVFDAAAATGTVQLYDAWDWPSGEAMWAEDRFHPNDRAYQHLSDNLYCALERHGIAGPPRNTIDPCRGGGGSV
ncbi:MAG: SGNH/GDSL hydrolase family protein [Acidimicrobiales bacterium]